MSWISSFFRKAIEKKSGESAKYNVGVANDSTSKTDTKSDNNINEVNNNPSNSNYINDKEDNSAKKKLLSGISDMGEDYTGAQERNLNRENGGLEEITNDSNKLENPEKQDNLEQDEEELKSNLEFLSNEEKIKLTNAVRKKKKLRKLRKKGMVISTKMINNMSRGPSAGLGSKVKSLKKSMVAELKKQRAERSVEKEEGRSRSKSSGFFSFD